MTYLKYAGFMILWGWILATGYVRYVLPLIASMNKPLVALEASGERYPGLMALLVRFLLALTQTWVLGIWSAWCVLRTMAFLRLPGTNGWLYYVSAFFICEGILGIVAKREPYNGVISVLHSALSMGLFVVFALNPAFLLTIYPWLPGMMKSPV